MTSRIRLLAEAGRKTILFFFFSVCCWRLGAQTAVVTDSAAVQLGRTISSDDDVQRQNRLVGLMDPASFIHRLEKYCPMMKDPAYRRSFIQSGSLPRMAASISNSANGGSYRLLREYDSTGVKHLLFRIFNEQGLNYHDYILTKVRDSIKVTDIYLYTTAEDMSQTMGDLVNTMIANMKQTKSSEEGEAISKIKDLYQQHKYSAAKAVYEGLSPKVRNSKAIQMMYLHVAQNLNDSVYEAALDRYQADFPDAPNSYLIMLDLYYVRKNYQKGLEELEKLDRLVRDPILDFYRGNYLTLSGKAKEGIAYYEKAYQYDPGFAPNTRNLIGSYAEAGRMDDAKRLIAEFKKQKDYHPQDLDMIYEAFPSLKE